MKTTQTTEEILRSALNAPMVVTEDLLRVATDAACVASYAYYGVRNTCVASSAALADALKRLGVQGVEVTRVRASPCHRSDHPGYDGPAVRVDCAILGYDEYTREEVQEFRRRHPGGWEGHLVVTVQGEWLLDATIGSAARVNGVHMPPLVGRIPPTWFDAGSNGCTVEDGDWDVWYYPTYPQRGWKTTPAFQRTNWRTISNAIVEAVLIAQARGVLPAEVDQAA